VKPVVVLAASLGTITNDPNKPYQVSSPADPLDTRLDKPCGLDHMPTGATTASLIFACSGRAPFVEVTTNLGSRDRREIVPAVLRQFGADRVRAEWAKIREFWPGWKLCHQ
jgi:hypothetical protein